MRKKYIRPEAFYESYVLSQHVAKCGWDLNFSTEETCYAVADHDLDGKPDFDEPEHLFLDRPTCQIKKDNYEGYCYTTGTDSFRVFNS